MLSIIVVAWRRSDIFKAEHCSSTVQQSLVIKILNADLQLQADFSISHSYDTNANYSPDSDCAAAQSPELISKFCINEINLRILKS